MPRRFYLDTDSPPDLGPISKRYQWCCDKGCGECDAVLVEFRTYHETTDGVTTGERTEPRMVSSCCGEPMFLWDTARDEDGPPGYSGELVGA